MIACLGGFCSSRDTCSEYQIGYGAGEQEETSIQIVERLCGEVEEPSQMMRVLNGPRHDLETKPHK